NKLEASYGLPAGIRATAGLDYEQKKRNQFRLRSVSSREETDEITVRGELRRSLGETLTGSVSLARSERDGSSFLNNILNGGGPGSNKIAPLHLADRERDKFGVSLSWTPTDPLSLQFRASTSKDDYASRGAEDLGLRDGRASLVSVDAAYQITDAWQATAFATQTENKINQATCAASPADGTPCTSPVWAANLRNVSRAVGVGANGKPLGNLKIGTELAVFRFRDSFGLTLAPVGGPLPDINTRLTTLKLFVEYALTKASGLRAHLVHDRYRSDDWTWANWTYTDGTRVTEDPDQKVNFIGLSYYYQFR
ncbi:MAG TPA: MtrB/PioB family outer membrane beta-barrel protein, partial [Burkholderiales bacterium]